MTDKRAQLKTRNFPDPSSWCGQRVGVGTKRTVYLTVSETYSGADIKIPAVVWRGKLPGPTLGVFGAIHGDEINGTGAIRKLIMNPPFELVSGTLIMIPVVNIFGFERHERYLPDRRDLNRCFPGSKRGSLASRLARAFFDTVVRRCHYIIDLHSAAVRRTNFPNVRADLTDPKLAAFATAFGAELMVSSTGPKGSLRAASAAIGVKSLILEAGEVWKVEPAAVEYAIRGIGNCLAHLGMVDMPVIPPPFLVKTDATRWIRANHGGLLSFHVSPGEIVDKGQPIATNTDLVGTKLSTIKAPRKGIILGMTTLPAVAPGDPICHIAFGRTGELQKVEQTVQDLDGEGLHERAKEDLAANLDVTSARMSE